MKVGLVGWATATGIGQINRELWDHGLVRHWLAPKHPTLAWNGDILPSAATPVPREGCENAIDLFFDQIDVLLFVERNDYITDTNMVLEAHRRGILTCCIPMMEWLPYEPWVAAVDMMWAVTRWTHDELQRFAADMKRLSLPCRWKSEIYGGRWGVDLDRFRYVPRGRVDRFLFCNGQGGVQGRKGLDVVAAAAAIVPKIPILVRSQKKIERELPPNMMLDDRPIMNNADLFAGGDVLLAPSRWEGIGLQLYEAQACGLPVLTTAAPPMTECEPLRHLRARQVTVDINDRPMPAWDVEPLHLAMTMKELFGREISAESLAAREFVEKNHDLAEVVDSLCSEIQGKLAAR